MKKRSINTRARPVWADSSSSLTGLESRNDALPDAIRAVFDLIDMTDPAWPGVAAALREFKDAGIEITPESAPIAVRLGRARFAAKSQQAPPVVLAAGADSIVYYVRRGTLIKIGTTENPRDRFRDLMPDAILAFEPGSYAEEKARHRQFAHLQVGPGWEHFRTDPVLLDHIAQMVSLYGPPDPAWPSVARGALEHWRLPLASSTTLMTAREAEEQLGIKRVTIRSWKRHGRLSPGGVGDNHTDLFYREHLIRLRDSTRERQADCF